MLLNTASTQQDQKVWQKSVGSAEARDLKGMVSEDKATAEKQGEFLVAETGRFPHRNNLVRELSQVVSNIWEDCMEEAMAQIGEMGPIRLPGADGKIFKTTEGQPDSITEIVPTLLNTSLVCQGANVPPKLRKALGGSRDPEACKPEVCTSQKNSYNKRSN